MHDTEDMTRSERTLAMIIARQAQEVTDALRELTGYDVPSAGQSEEMAERQHAAIVALLVGMRQPGEIPTMDELRQFIRGLAEGALLAVLGQPPDVIAEQQRN